MAKLPYDYVKAWRARPENKEKRKEESRRWRERHPDVAKAIKKRHRDKNIDALRPKEAEAARKRRAADPEGNKRRMLAFKARKEAERIAIAGRPRPSICDLCRGNTGGIVFDHCHESGKFRGWLCDRCNKVLGLVYDDPKLLRRMASYIVRNGAKSPRRPKSFAVQKELLAAD